MIKKYKLFLESISDVSFEDEYEAFKDALRSCELYYADRGLSQFGTSYSRTAQDGQFNEDPEEDYKLVVDYLAEDEGWDEDRVDFLFDSMYRINERICDDNPSITAPIDYYLYKKTNRKFPLQGVEWDVEGVDTLMNRDWDDVDPDTDEILIKFGYGWHKTKYGKICIEQNLGSVNNFLLICFDMIPKLISTSLIDGILTTGRLADSSFIDELNEFFITHKESMYIDIDSESMVEKIREIASGYGAKGYLSRIDTQDKFDDYLIGICNKQSLTAKSMGEGNVRISLGS